MCNTILVLLAILPVGTSFLLIVNKYTFLFMYLLVYVPSCLCTYLFMYLLVYVPSCLCTFLFMYLLDYVFFPISI